MSAKRIEPGSASEGADALPVIGVGVADLSDAALVSRAARADAAAYRVLVERHLALVLAIGRRMLRDDAEAEDIAQEAMLRLWRNAARLEVDDHGVKPWLRRVTSNLCIDRVRSGRGTTVTDEVPDQESPASQLRELSERDMSGRVDQALKLLPERQRQALVLFHFDGLSQIEVGMMMGVSDEAVESLLGRARRALKTQLKDEWRHLLPEADP